MTLYLELTGPTSWREGDFSTETKLAGTIYTDRAMTQPKDITGFVPRIRLYKRWHIIDFFSKDASVVSGTDGTWDYAVALGEMPRHGIYLFEIELTKTGVAESTQPVEFRITRSPRP